MKWKEIVAGYLTFTRKERIGIISVLIITTIVIFNGFVININPMVDVSYLILQAIVAFSICHGYNDVDEQQSSITAYKDTI